MAQKPTVTVKFQILDLIENFVDGSTADAIGNTVVQAAKQMISEGQSPVRGFGRFEAYKDPKKYPGKKKDQRPVNLYLSGRMLEQYGFTLKNPTTLRIGIDEAGAAEIAGYHNEGTDRMAMRALIPKEGEEWAVTIMRAIAEEYGKRLAELIKASNK